MGVGMRSMPGLGIRSYWTPGSDDWEIENDPDLRLISVVTQLCVKDRIAALPGAPTQGDIYLLTATADANKIAVYDDAEWVLFTPQEGWRAWVADENTVYTFYDTSWHATVDPAAGDASTLAAATSYTDAAIAALPADGPQYLDVATYCAGKPGVSELLIGYIFNGDAELPIGLTGSNFRAMTTATASATFTIYKNAASIGTLVFGIGANTPTITFTTLTTFAAGDRLTLGSPATQDATLADIFFNLRATKA